MEAANRNRPRVRGPATFADEKSSRISALAASYTAHSKDRDVFRPFVIPAAPRKTEEFSAAGRPRGHDKGIGVVAAPPLRPSDGSE